MAAWYIHNAPIIFQISLFPTVFGKSRAKNRHTTVVLPTELGTIYCFRVESKMYNILEHTELYLTVLLIIVLAISVPWC